MLVPQTIRRVDPYRLAMESGVSRTSPLAMYRPNVARPGLTNQLRGCDCTREGLGLFEPTDSYGPDGTGPDGQVSVLGAISVGASFLPGVGPIAAPAIQIMSQAIKNFETWMGIGKGRKEADLIVPIQNDLMNRLGTVTNAILVGKAPNPIQLQSYYDETWQLGTAFCEFVMQKTFTDRRASGQALNTVMPYIDGSCGYAIPLGNQVIPGTTGCLTWGAGTLGGAGTDGMLGALSRAIVAGGNAIVPPAPGTCADLANFGYKVPGTGPGNPLPPPPPPPPPGTPSPLTAGLSSPLAIAVGLLAVYMFAKK